MELPAHLEPIRGDLERLVQDGAPEAELTEFVSAWPPSAMQKTPVHAPLDMSVPAPAPTGPSPHDRDFVKAHATPLTKWSTTPFAGWQQAALGLLPPVAALGAGVGKLTPSLVTVNIGAVGLGPSVSAGFYTEWGGVGGGLCLGLDIRRSSSGIELALPVGLYGSLSYSDLLSQIVTGKYSATFTGAGASIDLNLTFVRRLDDFAGAGYALGGDLFVEAGGGAFLLFDSNWTWIGVSGYGGAGAGMGLGVLHTFGGVVHT